MKNITKIIAISLIISVTLVLIIYFVSPLINNIIIFSIGNSIFIPLLFLLITTLINIDSKILPHSFTVSLLFGAALGIYILYKTENIFLYSFRGWVAFKYLIFSFLGSCLVSWILYFVNLNKTITKDQ